MFEITEPKWINHIGEHTVRLSLVFFAIFFVFYYILQRRYTKNLTKLYSGIATFFIIQLLSSYIHNTYFSIDNLFGLFAMLSFIVLMAHSTWKTKYYKLFGYVFSIFILYIAAYWLIFNPVTDGFSAIFINPNGLAIILFCMFFFQLLSFFYASLGERFYFGGISILNIFLIYSTSSRNVYLALAIVLFSFILLSISKKMFSLLFYLAIGFNVVFTICYTLLVNTRVGDYLNTISIKLFNKNFFSGRSEIWFDLWSPIMDKPFFGHGIGVDARDFTMKTAHNQYMQTLLESGIIGLIAFFFILFILWKLLLKNLHSFEAKLSACFFIATLIYANFELTLFQNNYAIGILQWLLMTLGISITDKEYTNSNLTRLK